MDKKKTLISLFLAIAMVPSVFAGNKTTNFGLNRWVNGDIDYVAQQNEDSNTLDAALTAVNASSGTNAVNISTNGVAITALENSKVDRAGDAMTGQLTIAGSSLTVGGDIGASGTGSFGDITSGNSYSFTADADTFIDQPALDQLNLTVGGDVVLSIQESGAIISSFTSVVEIYSQSQHIRLFDTDTGDGQDNFVLQHNGHFDIGLHDGSGIPSTSFQIQKDGDVIISTTPDYGNLGVGLTNPAVAVDVVGDIQATGSGSFGAVHSTGTVFSGGGYFFPATSLSNYLDHTGSNNIQLQAFGELSLKSSGDDVFIEANGVTKIGSGVVQSTFNATGDLSIPGEFTAENQPGARAYSTTGAVFQSNVFRRLEFDTEKYDNGGIHSYSVGASTFTIPSDGVYFAACGYRMTTNASGIRQVNIQVNLTSIAEHAKEAQSFSTERINVATVYKMTAGDEVYCVGRQSSGGDLAITTHEASYMVVEKLH